MADRPRIGNPLPRGVVDESHDFIGVPSQGVDSPDCANRWHHYGQE